MRRAFVLALGLASAVVVRADDTQVRVRVRLDPAGPVVTGQAVRLVVDVLVTTWLTGQPELPPLDVPGAVVAPSSEQTVNLTQQIDGTTWFGVSQNWLSTTFAGSRASASHAS